MSTTEVLIPDIGDFDEVDVIEILVSIGDEVLEETPLMTLESDKATMDIPSPASGKINKILIAVGDKVSKDRKVFEIEVNSEKITETDEKNLDADKTAKYQSSDDTSVEIRVPDIGDFDQVDVVDVLVREGAQIQKEQPIITLESDKATMDLPSPVEGVVLKLSVQIGDKVGEGDVISVLDISGNKENILPPREVAPTISKEKKERDNSNRTSDVPFLTEETSNNIAHASPSVRKFARELGVDITKLKGSGNNFRILHSDVQKYVKEQMSIDKNRTNQFFEISPNPEIDYSQFGEVEQLELTKIQHLTGRNLHRSWITAPHVFQMDEADITELERFRHSKIDEMGERNVKLTLLSFIMKACASALIRFPKFNSSLNNDRKSLTLKKYINIGFAVNTDRGLVVPVIKNIEKKGLVEIATEIQELAQKARDKQLAPGDMQGGTFTVSSLG